VVFLVFSGDPKYWKIGWQVPGEHQRSGTALGRKVVLEDRSTVVLISMTLIVFLLHDHLSQMCAIVRRRKTEYSDAAFELYIGYTFY